jgi:coenzyme F420-reducing hydrogenase delta subunit
MRMSGTTEAADTTQRCDSRRIAAFCCENSALQAAEAADGLHDLVEIVPLPCSGKMEIGLVLQMLERGHPGVLILGCPRDSCKFLTGNLRAEKRAQRIRGILRDIGYGEERVRMDFLSSLDSHRFGEIVKRMEEDLRSTGRNAAVQAIGGGAASRAEGPRASSDTAQGGLS